MRLEVSMVFSRLDLKVRMKALVGPSVHTETVWGREGSLATMTGLDHYS